MVLASLLINLGAPLRAPAPVLDDLLHAVCTVGGMVQDVDAGTAQGPDAPSCVFCLPLLHAGPLPVMAGLAVPSALMAAALSLPPIFVVPPRPAPGPAAPRAPPY